jgi:hypothetical protein
MVFVIFTSVSFEGTFAGDFSGDFSRLLLCFKNTMATCAHSAGEKGESNRPLPDIAQDTTSFLCLSICDDAPARNMAPAQGKNADKCMTDARTADDAAAKNALAAEMAVQKLDENVAALLLFATDLYASFPSAAPENVPGASLAEKRQWAATQFCDHAYERVLSGNERAAYLRDKQRLSSHPLLRFTRDDAFWAHLGVGRGGICVCDKFGSAPPATVHTCNEVLVACDHARSDFFVDRACARQLATALRLKL